MNVLSKLLVLLLSLTIFAVAASESFRLDNGEIIYTGMSKQQLVVAVGKPESVEELAGTDKFGNAVKLDEQILHYSLKGDIGGEYMVAAKVRRGTVIELEVTQLKR